MRKLMTDGRRGGTGKGVGIGIGASVAMLAATIGAMMFAKELQVKMVEAHLAALRAKDVAGAFKDIDSERVSKNYVQALFDRNPQVFGSDRVSVTPRFIEDSCGHKYAQIEASIVGTDGKTYAITYLLEGNGGWTIDSIYSEDLAQPPGGRESMRPR